MSLPEPSRDVVTQAVRKPPVRWTSLDLAVLLRKDPGLADSHLSDGDLVARVRAAKNALPPERRRACKPIWSLISQYRQHFQDKLSQVRAASPASFPPSAPAIQAPRSTERGTHKGSKGGGGIRWSPAELTVVARAVSTHLRPNAGFRPPRFTDAVMIAQAHCLPPDRWRPRGSIYQACFAAPPMDLRTVLRGALHNPVESPAMQQALFGATPVTEDVTPVTPDVTPDVTPSVTPTVAPASPAQALASAIEAMSAHTIAGMEARLMARLDGIEDRVTARCAVLLREHMASLIGDTVRATVIDVLGAPASPAPVPPPPAVPPMPEPAQDPAPPAVQEPEAPAPAQQHRAVAVHAHQPPPERPRKKRVDVVGLVGGQMTIVQKAIGEAFDLRFVSADACSGSRQKTYSSDVVMCTKFVSHDAQESIRAKGGRVHYANGGAASVIDVLRTLPRIHPVHAQQHH